MATRVIENVLREKKLNLTIKLEQSRIIETLCKKIDVFGVLPTGYGKSLTYTLTPLVMNELYPDRSHTALVISPLKSLMADQVQYLNSHNIHAAAITERTSKKEISEMKTIDVLFTSPESILLRKWQELLKIKLKDRVCVLVFDEAHCISSWGQDFRPSYRQAPPVIQSLFVAPNLILTATATQQIQADIYDLLGLKAETTCIVSALPDRPNIYLDVGRSTDKFEEELAWLRDMLMADIGKVKVIIYVRTLKHCSDICSWLLNELMVKTFNGKPSAFNRRVEMFHANTDQDSKDRILERFSKKDGKLEVLVCTVAFGMGVNIPDVDMVIHWGLPGTSLEYWQEVGRCSRDGRKGFAKCYAFKRSITRCVENDLKNSTYGGCIRHSVLKNFLLEGMDVGELDKLQLNNDCVGCETLCKCRKCMCCSFCFSTCTCVAKAESPLKQFISAHSV